MYLGKTMFAQVMEFVPWTSFARTVQRHGGNSGVQALSCAEQFRAMAFAQLTWRESLRDTEASLSANASKLYAMGFSSAVKRSTLADANESRDWRIWNVLDMLAFEPGAFHAMDRGYVDFARLVALHQAGAFFVTRAKSPMDARRGYSAATDRSTGVISDQRVMLNGDYAARKYPEHLRRVRFKYPESGKTLILLTNNTALPVLTTSALYKSRWHIDLLFIWIKQLLRIKKCLGNSENAVKTQAWCAVVTYVPIAIVKKELQLEASLYTCLQILSASVFEKTQISCAFQPYASQSDLLAAAKQSNLFEF